MTKFGATQTSVDHFSLHISVGHFNVGQMADSLLLVLMVVLALLKQALVLALVLALLGSALALYLAAR